MDEAQPGILAPVPLHARYVFYDLLPDADPKEALAELVDREIDEELVIGLGASLVWAAGGAVEGLHTHPVLVGPGVTIPSTPHALVAWHRGEERGEVVLAARDLEEDLVDFFEVHTVIDAFRYREGRDLTGYVDGTENPTGDDAVAAAFVKGQAPGLDGSSFLAVSQWTHDLSVMLDLDDDERDRVIGRTLEEDEELADAPPAAHVKRTEQESFDPPAFIVRRSMPWADEDDEGLVFVAFGSSSDSYERILRHMVGLDDGVTDALFRFTRPTSAAYFWCPPIRDDKPDLRALRGPVRT